ncbi:MAG: class II fructose-bisphosphate aldolase [Lachnospiraceae bacterium]|nr:class II fructose-bisphosphate aldolase [Lachnospiraceae bacterium]
MKTRNFLEELQYAKEHKYAVGAFNIFNYLSARAVIRAASTMDLPVILQTSSATVRKFGPVELGTMLRQLAWNAPVNVIIHLDHCTDINLAKACMDSGWDSIMYDGSKLPLEENIAGCREVVSYAHKRGIKVEGELGKIGGVEDEIVVDLGETEDAKLDESIYFVKESGIDAFAPAVGTAHGLYKGTPKIDFNLVEQLSTAVPAPIVIHGGTGLPESTFEALVNLGAAKINVSTAIKHAYIDNCKEYMKANPDKLDPIDFDYFLNCAIKNVAMDHMKVFTKNKKD